MLSKLDRANLRIKVLEAELAALKSGPDDAAVREAMEVLVSLPPYKENIDPLHWVSARVAINTLLSYVRAAQAPRLTGERLEAVRKANALIDSDCLQVAFPELGEGVSDVET